MKQITLKNGTQMPALGFGTWQIEGDECIDAVDTALSVGYRHIDTADAYHNHTEVGLGIAKNGILREELFLTTKIFPGDLTAESVRKKIDTFLAELNTDYIDLLLIHYPDHSVPLAETLGAMKAAQAAGQVRSLGVSNFTEHHLEDAMETGVEIVVNQVELHPGFAQHDMRAFCKKHDIAVTAYSPLGRGDALEMELITTLAKKYEKTSGQIILNWLLSLDLIAIPKSTHTERIKENFAAEDFTMDQADIDAIDALNTSVRLINPEFAHFDY